MMTSDTRMRFCRNFYRRCKVNSLPYQTLLKNIETVNDLVDCYVSAEGKKLHFSIVEDTDRFFWWRSTIIILMEKVDFDTGVPEGNREFGLCQFVQVYNNLSGNAKVLEMRRERPTSPSVTYSGGTLEKECCICQERPKDIVLPCAHAFCKQCIQQWKMTANSCPMCRFTLGSAGETWEVEECPKTVDIQQETQIALEMLLDTCK